MTTKDLARYCQVSERTIEYWLTSGYLPSREIGDILEFLRQKKHITKQTKANAKTKTQEWGTGGIEYMLSPRTKKLISEVFSGE